MKPILFNTDMVRAILAGQKTVTRRVVKPQPPGMCSTLNYDEEGHTVKFLADADCIYFVYEAKAPYQPGDLLYVRETWYYESHMEDMTAGEPDLPSGAYSHRYIFKADCQDYPVNVGVGPHGWRPSIHMPREAARIFLRVTDVRVERLQDITETQALKEGAVQVPYATIVDDVDGKTKSGVMQWVIAFERCEKPQEG